jgi:hypothetical protein
MNYLQVERRETDFEWFHDQLSEQHPEFIIPPTPDKSSANKSMTRFMEAVMGQFELSDSQLTWLFLQAPEQVE